MVGYYEYVYWCGGLADGKTTPLLTALIRADDNLRGA